MIGETYKLEARKVKDEPDMAELYTWLNYMIEQAEFKGHDHLALSMTVATAKKLAKVINEGLYYCCPPMPKPSYLVAVRVTDEGGNVIYEKKETKYDGKVL